MLSLKTFVQNLNNRINNSLFILQSLLLTNIYQTQIHTRIICINAEKSL